MKWYIQTFFKDEKKEKLEIEVNKKNMKGLTPLYLACYEIHKLANGKENKKIKDNRLEIVKLLIESGADVNF